MCLYRWLMWVVYDNYCPGAWGMYIKTSTKLELLDNNTNLMYYIEYNFFRYHLPLKAGIACVAESYKI